MFSNEMDTLHAYEKLGKGDAYETFSFGGIDVTEADNYNFIYESNTDTISHFEVHEFCVTVSNNVNHIILRGQNSTEDGKPITGSRKKVSNKSHIIMLII